MDQEGKKDFLTCFTFVMNSFKDMEDDMGALSLLNIAYLDKWAPFHSMEPTFQDLDVANRQLVF
jgi:hypothetical protein